MHTPRLSPPLRTSPRLVSLGFLCVALAGVPGCKKDEPAEGEPKQAFSPQVPGTLSSVKGEIEVISQSYEKARALLAADQIEAVSGAADTLSTAALTAAVKAPNLRGQLNDIAQPAADLKKMSKSDADAVRKQFGEVSRGYIALLMAEPGLQKGLHVFECPMAQGYKQWVQPSDKLENPYMGKAMLECGAPGKWE